MRASVVLPQPELADQRHHLARPDRQVDAVDRTQRALALAAARPTPGRCARRRAPPRSAPPRPPWMPQPLLMTPPRARAGPPARRSRRGGCSAPDGPARRAGLQRHLAVPAGVDDIRAAAGEVAAAHLADQRRHHAGDGAELLAAPRRAGHRNAGEQPARIGMRRRREDRLRACRSPPPAPAYITATRVAMRATMPRSCVISTSPMANSRCSSASRCRICAWMVTSSAVVGSSARISEGPHISAMAIITRWRSPPDSWCGYCFRRLGRRGDADAIEQIDAPARAPAGAPRGDGAAAPPPAGCRWCRPD